MRPIKKILVPTDFSEGSEEAIRYALDLAGALGASVTLFHAFHAMPYVFPDGTAILPPPGVVAEWMRRVDDALAEAKKRAETISRVPISTKSSGDVPFQEIVRLAREEDYDLIVMGTHGRTGLRHLFLGSVAEQVVRRSDRPVLTVRAGSSKSS